MEVYVYKSESCRQDWEQVSFITGICYRLFFIWDSMVNNNLLYFFLALN